MYYSAKISCKHKLFLCAADFFGTTFHNLFAEKSVYECNLRTYLDLNWRLTIFHSFWEVELERSAAVLFGVGWLKLNVDSPPTQVLNWRKMDHHSLSLECVKPNRKFVIWQKGSASPFVKSLNGFNQIENAQLNGKSRYGCEAIRLQVLVAWQSDPSQSLRPLPISVFTCKLGKFRQWVRFPAYLSY